MTTHNPQLKIYSNSVNEIDLSIKLVHDGTVTKIKEIACPVSWGYFITEYYI